MKDSKINGEFDKDYKVLNKVNFKVVFEDTFAKTNLCYLVLSYKGIDVIIETLLWQDEIDYLKKVITFPSIYKVEKKQTRANIIKIKVYKAPEDIKRIYKTLNEQDFVEYIKRVLQGY